MNMVRRCGAAALSLAFISFANAGVQVIKTTGWVAGNAQTTSVDMSFSDAQGGHVNEAGAGFNLFANAVAFITCGDSASGNSYASMTVNPTSLRIDGQASSQAMSFGTALTAAADAHSDLNVTFTVDAPTKWSLPVGWVGNDGGAAHFILRRAGTTITLFDSRISAWQSAKGMLATGTYELEIACLSSATVAADGSPEQFFSGFANAYYDIMLELKQSLTAPRAADINLDGFVDFTDFDAFVLTFETGSSLADFNADGFVDFTDADSFVAAFESGW